MFINIIRKKRGRKNIVDRINLPEFIQVEIIPRIDEERIGYLEFRIHYPTWRLCRHSDPFNKNSLIFEQLITITLI